MSTLDSSSAFLYMSDPEENDSSCSYHPLRAARRLGRIAMKARLVTGERVRKRLENRPPSREDVSHNQEDSLPQRGKEQDIRGVDRRGHTLYTTKNCPREIQARLTQNRALQNSHAYTEEAIQVPSAQRKYLELSYTSDAQRSLPRQQPQATYYSSRKVPSYVTSTHPLKTKNSASVLACTPHEHSRGLRSYLPGFTTPGPGSYETLSALCLTKPRVIGTPVYRASAHSSAATPINDGAHGSIRTSRPSSCQVRTTVVDPSMGEEAQMRRRPQTATSRVDPTLTPNRKGAHTGRTTFGCSPRVTLLHVLGAPPLVDPDLILDPSTNLELVSAQRVDVTHAYSLIRRRLTRDIQFSRSPVVESFLSKGVLGNRFSVVPEPNREETYIPPRVGHSRWTLDSKVVAHSSEHRTHRGWSFSHAPRFVSRNLSCATRRRHETVTSSSILRLLRAGESEALARKEDKIRTQLDRSVFPLSNHERSRCRIRGTVLNLTDQRRTFYEDERISSTHQRRGAIRIPPPFIVDIV